MRLEIDNVQIQLVTGERIELTRSNAQVTKLGQRSGSYTNDFKVPMTPSNMEALGFSNELSAENEIRPERRYEAQIFRGTGGEVKRGFVQIVSADYVNKTFTLTFFTDNTSWIDLLKGKDIRDIWLKDYNHTWNKANIVASWTNTEGYIYPFIEYGRFAYQFSTNTFIDDWYPSVFQSTLVKRMFEAIGWVAKGEFIDSWVHKHTIIPFTNSQFLEDNAEELEARAEYPTTKGYDLTATPASGTTDTQTDTIEINTIITDNVGNFDLAQNRYTADRALKDAVFVGLCSSSTASINFSNASFTDATITLQLRKNGSVEQEIELISAENVSGVYSDSVSGDYVISLTTDMSINDYIDFAVVLEYTDAVAASTIVQLLFQVGSFAFALQSVSGELLPDGNVTLSNNLPSIDQADFIKDIMLRHGLLAIPDQYARTVEFVPFSKLINSSNRSQNLSDYVNVLSAESIDFSRVVRDYAKQSRFFYTDPNQDDKELIEYNNLERLPFGAGELEVDNDFIEGVKEIYRSPFGATKQVKSFNSVFGHVYLPYIPRVSYDGGDTLNTKPRLLLVVQDTYVGDFSEGFFTVTIDAAPAITNTAFAYFAKPLFNSNLDNINESLAFDIPNITAKMGDGLLDRWYSDWLNILNKPRFVELGVKLWEHQFEELNLDLPVFIDSEHIRGYFLIDQIVYREGRDLIRLIQLQ